METILLKYFQGQPLSDVEITEFLQYYLDTVAERKYTGQQLTGILTLLRHGQFQLRTPMEEACRRFPSLQLYKLYNPQGQLVSYQIFKIEQQTT